MSLIYKTKAHRLTSEASYPLHSKSSDDEDADAFGDADAFDHFENEVQVIMVTTSHEHSQWELMTYVHSSIRQKCTD
jgi:hypothetical protein